MKKLKLITAVASAGLMLTSSALAQASASAISAASSSLAQDSEWGFCYQPHGSILYMTGIFRVYDTNVSLEIAFSDIVSDETNVNSAAWTVCRTSYNSNELDDYRHSVKRRYSSFRVQEMSAPRT